jgi:hypothetical protein
LAFQDFGDAAPHRVIQADLLGAMKNSVQRRWKGIEISNAGEVSQIGFIEECGARQLGG